MSKWYTLIVAAACLCAYGYCQSGNPRSDLFRPCDIFDLPCIRNYFQKHGHCTPGKDRVPEPYFIPKNVMYLPSYNLTVIQVNIFVTGLTGNVREFYINQTTDRIVFAVEYQNINITANAAYYKFHRSAQEPMVVRTSINELYPSIVTITTVIPDSKKPNFRESESRATVTIPPMLTLPPDFLASQDANVRTTILATNLPAAVQESFLSRAPLFMAIYFKNVICDFGFHV